MQEIDFLGYWITPNSVKPMKKKIDTELRMDQPRDKTQIRSFIGANNNLPLNSSSDKDKASVNSIKSNQHDAEDTVVLNGKTY